MKDSNSITYFLCGLGLGAVAGVLMAAKPGAETRDQIAGKAAEARDMLASKLNDGVDYVKRSTQDLRTVVDEKIQTGKQAVQQQADSLSAAFEAGKKTYRESAGRQESGV
jgi:gas vesicle protein